MAKVGGNSPDNLVALQLGEPFSGERFDAPPELGALSWIFMKRSVNDWGGKHNDSSFAKLYRLVDKPRIVMQSDDYRVIESAVLEGAGAG